MIKVDFFNWKKYPNGEEEYRFPVGVADLSYSVEMMLGYRNLVWKTVVLTDSEYVNAVCNMRFKNFLPVERRW